MIPQFRRSPSARRLLAAALVAGQAAACTTVARTPYSASEAAVATVPGVAGARYSANDAASAFVGVAPQGVRGRGTYTYLALSGGGGDGAYGAGVLSGWTASGTRPTFSVVSGVSTGALIAPFAFLGSGYDASLRAIYTSGEAESLIRSPNLLNAVFGSGLFGDDRLRTLVGRYVTPELVAAVAEEHAKGRRLLVVTTNLDAQRPVIWDLGAVAASGRSDAVKLFGDVLTASASIPAVFPPQLIDVEANGRPFQEMHVDGSVVTPVFTLPESYLTRDLRLRGGKAELFVIINGRLEPSFRVVPDSTIPIVERSFTTASRSRSRAGLATTYAFAHRNGVGFNLTYIDPSLPEEPVGKGFDTAYMRNLFDVGYRTAESGSFWRHNLPSEPGTAVATASRF
jgi:predicted acylesterase/phospholipase RssA